MKSRRQLPSLLGAVLIVFAVTGVPATRTLAQAQGTPAWATDYTTRYYAAFNSGDTAAIAKLYAPDAVLLLQDQTFRGKPAIEAFHKGNFAKARFDCTWTIRGAIAIGRLATVWGDDRCVDTPKSGGRPVNWSGRWITVYEQQRDGSRLIVRDGSEEVRPARGRQR